MSQDLLDWTDVLALDDLPLEVITPVSIGEKALVLYRSTDGIRAFDGKCPHKGAPMEQGVACKSRHGDVQLVCPWHKASFSAESGRLIAPPALDPLNRYPVEVHDGRVLVGKQAIRREPPAPMHEHETVAIIGAGAAAIAAAVTLREEGYAGRVLLISPEAELPYDRTALSKMVLGSGEKDAAPPALRPESWYEANNIERITDRVTKLDIEGRTLSLGSGKTLTPDHILIASGSRARALDIPGAALPGVKLLRGAEDARAIIASVDEKISVVVIGSGFIGMEAAAALRKRGAGVTVVSQSALPFEKQLGKDIASAMRSLHEEKGVAFIPSRKVKAITGGEAVSGVELDDGTRIGATLVLAGIGAEPVLDFLPDYAINDQGGIDVDEAMRVGAHVYAAGDIASMSHEGQRYRIEHWRTAQCQARIAARTMLGLPGGDLPTPWFWTQQYDRKIEYLGWPQPHDAVQIDGSAQSFDFMAQYVAQDKTVGLAAASRPKEMGKAAVTFDDA
ncbi:rubredoxin-NAD(+) reductase [Asaia sp. W19]|uniref:FAD-dependent oxidoreductase n=1 Tax=unclassified Asaia TaxID=2685023 RepID=UPI000F8C47A0|nr:FAD-dependent oxidoreductase [Asaia sp. W19]RUT27053.1 rubredoxin-NAD(+) reductase [Asaia sp. W19]